MCVRALYQVNSKWQRKVKVKVAIRESVRRVLHNYYHIFIIHTNKQTTTTKTIHTRIHMALRHYALTKQYIK